MPLPTPNKDEKADAFLSRCMGNPTAREDFPDQDQRFAVCQRQLKTTRKRERLDAFLKFVFSKALGA